MTFASFAVNSAVFPSALSAKSAVQHCSSTQNLKLETKNSYDLTKITGSLVRC
jgi:hypothetical protein